MTKYITEVGNLSVHESRVIGAMIDDAEAKVADAVRHMSFCLDMVERLESLGQDRAAATYRDQCEAARRNAVEALIHVGHSWTYFGDNFNSEASYRKAVQLDPRNADPHTYIGRALLDRGEFSSALASLEAAQELSPDDAMMLFYLGEAYFEMGRVAESDVCYRRLVSAAPEVGTLQFVRRSIFAPRAFTSLERNFKWRAAVAFDGTEERDLERLRRLAGNRPIYITHICGRGWILSHMVNQIEAFVRHLHLDGVRDPFIVILNADEFCNDELVRMYDRTLWLIDGRYPALRRRLVRLREWLKTKGSPIAAQIDPHNPRPHVVNYFQSQLKCWTDAPRILQFTEEQHARGREVLSDLGIRPNEFVCFGIREAAYYKDTWLGRGTLEDYWEINSPSQKREEFGAIFGYSGARGNVWYERSETLHTKLETYLPMADRLAGRGVPVLRMGVLVDGEIPAGNGRVIDYARHHRTEFGDVYVFANCKFVVAGGTGTMWISAAFGKPVVNTDMYLPNNTFFNTSQDGIPNLSIPRKYWYKEEKRFLRYGEVFRVFRRYQSMQNCQIDGIENVANTSDEIGDVVEEMNARIDGKWETTAEDCELQERFRALHQRRDHAYGTNGLIGAKFLRDNADLIR